MKLEPTYTLTLPDGHVVELTEQELTDLVDAGIEALDDQQVGEVASSGVDVVSILEGLGFEVEVKKVSFWDAPTGREWMN